MRYTQFTDDNVKQMLSTIGAESVDALFEPIPQELRLNRELALPRGVSELEMLRDARSLAGRNHGCEELVCFLGGGAYDHFVPTLVDAIAGQSEFLTAYTPYQAEASQGMLQLLYEYQSMVCMLTGMEVANASLYEVSSATAEAVMMATGITGRSQVVVAGTVHPDTQHVLKTYASHRGVDIVTSLSPGGVVDEEDLAGKICDETAAVVVQSPNYFGLIERLDRIIPSIHSCGALAIVAFDPLARGVLQSPGALDADIVVGEGQALGIPLQYGGPYLGLLATRRKYLRKMPGRVVGAAVDRQGRRGFCLALQTREQHIKRDRATSNVCTNEGLLAVRATIHLAALGKKGIGEVASQCFDKAHYAAKQIASLDGYELRFDAPFFKEFVVRTNRSVSDVLARCRRVGILAGIPLGDVDEQLSDCFLVAVTEKRTRAEIDRLVETLGEV